jgi:hypothetical protein
MMHIVSGVPHVVDMVPAQEVTNNLTSLTRSVGIVNN